MKNEQGPPLWKVKAAILAAQNGGLGFAAIAKSLGVSRQRIGFTAQRLYESGELEKYPYSEYVISDAAEVLGLPYKDVLAACYSGLVKCHIWTNLKRNTYRVPQAELASIPIAIGLLRERYCHTCGTYFIPKSPLGNPKTCSPECQRRRDIQIARAGRLKGTQDPDALYNRLKSELPAPSGDWRIVSEAAKETGLDKRTIRNLILWEVLPTSIHPSRKWRGEPMLTVNLNQVMCIKHYY